MIGMGAIEIAIGDTGSTLMRRVLAIDLGGTNIRSAAGTGDMVNLRHLRRETAPATLDAFVACVFGLIAQAGDIDAIGLAIPGLVDGTVCRWVPNLPYLDGVDLAALFPGLSLSVGNDAHFALLAEAKRGAGKSLSDVLLLAIGTGIGSAVLVNGSIAKGAHGAACSFGWTCADVEDAGAERDGWLERVASGRAINAHSTRSRLRQRRCADRRGSSRRPSRHRAGRFAGAAPRHCACWRCGAACATGHSGIWRNCRCT